MNFPNIQLTRAGVAAILKALRGDEIQFSKIKLGDGTAPATEEARRNLTDLVHPVFSCGITEMEVEDGFATLAFNFDNAHIGDTGFYARELGVYMTDDNDNDVLYGYTNAGAECGYIKPFAQDSFIQTSFRVTVAVGDAENVTAIIAPAIGFVSDEEFEAHLDDFNNPHKVTKKQVGLENVPNLTPSNMTINFTTAANNDPMVTGATIAVIAGKVNKLLEEIAGVLEVTDDVAGTEIEFTNAANIEQMDPSGASIAEIAGKVNKILDELSHSSSVEPSQMSVTYTEAQTLSVPSSPANMASLMGQLAKAIRTLIEHINNHTNPHSVTYAQVHAAAENHTHTLADLGAAASSHTHNASDINAGTLPVARGGTGVTSYEALAAEMSATVAETKSYLEID